MASPTHRFWIIIIKRHRCQLERYLCLSVGRASWCVWGGINHLCRSSDLTVKHGGWHQHPRHRPPCVHLCEPQWPLRFWPTRSFTGGQTSDGQVSSRVQNDPVDDLWSDVPWADIAPLARGGTAVWLHGGCVSSRFAYVFHLALWKIFLIEAPFISHGTRKNCSAWKRKKLWACCGKISDQRNSWGRNMMRRRVRNILFIPCFMEHSGLMGRLALLHVRGVGFLRCLWAIEPFLFVYKVLLASESAAHKQDVLISASVEFAGGGDEMNVSFLLNFKNFRKPRLT